MPRHTTLKKKLTRSFGVESGEDRVVELDDAGYVTFRREPTHRRLKRGEKLPELKLDIEEVMDTLSGPPVKESELVEILEGIASQVPIAKLEGLTPEKAAYELKVWLIQTMKRTIENAK